MNRTDREDFLMTTNRASISTRKTGPGQRCEQGKFLERHPNRVVEKLSDDDAREQKHLPFFL